MNAFSYFYCRSRSVNLTSKGRSVSEIVTDLLPTTCATRGSRLLRFCYFMNASCFYNSQQLLELSGNSSTQYTAAKEAALYLYYSRKNTIDRFSMSRSKKINKTPFSGYQKSRNFDFNLKSIHKEDHYFP